MPIDPLVLLGHLADESRLRTFAAVLLAPEGPPDTATVARLAGLPVAETLRLLARLESAGLVGRTDTGWTAYPEVLRQAVAAQSPRRESIDHGTSDPGEAAVLRVFMPAGQLTQIPAQRSKRLVVLDQIVRVFEPGRRYTEKEVTVALKAFHPDHASLRRYLVDEGFLSREDGVYWRSGGTFLV